jgi:hypothetical protein
MYSLFALLHGDMIFDTYQDLSSFSYILGQLYMYIFILLFITYEA